MARSGPPVFMEESDEDSIGTDSTAESEHDEDESFNVERVLAYSADHEGSGTPAYLIKWEGYQLPFATWEPPDNIEDDRLIEQFEDDKRRAELGQNPDFFEQQPGFEQARAMMLKSKADRQRRRKEKRLRRGLPLREEDEDFGRATSAGPLDDGDDEDVNTAASSARLPKLVNTAPVKRKGIAQKAKAPCRHSSGWSEKKDEPGEQDADLDSDLNSLFEEGSQPIYPELHQPPQPTSQPKLKAQPTSAPNKAKAKAKAPAPSVARQSAAVPAPTAKTTGKTAKRTNIFPKSVPGRILKRRLPLTTEGAPTDSNGGPRAIKLSIQNR
ncbi:hypothetical protein B0A50_06899 [Salinomyces thailandicus]|uniref:Chromo domain-containing protein n=1 Tax=Salinomyces thailandicus TaxID=706561 RepID=A0A4U0TPM3_9PEZI|nr:hypothetical protein B0A50_06899 [Salinomyces thailandica]